MKLFFADKFSIMYATLGRRVFFLRPLRKLYAGVVVSCFLLMVLNVLYIEDSFTWDINTALSYLDQSYEDYQTVSDWI